MKNNTIRSKNVRDLLEKSVTKIPVNTSFTVGTVAAEISTRSRNVDARSVGRFLRERDDVKQVSGGVWMRVPV